MTVHELFTILSRAPHDAIVLVDAGGDPLEAKKIIVQMSADLYEARDHVIIEVRC